MKRRSWKMVTLAAVASLGLSACSVPAALSLAQNTYGGDAYLQVHFTTTLTSANPSLASVSKTLAHLTFDVNEQSRSGAPIKSSLNQLNQDLVVWHGATRVATILESGSNLYFNVDFTALARVPGTSSSASTLSALNLLLGQRWIELPYSLVAKYAGSAAGVHLNRSVLATGQVRLLNAVVGLLARVGATPTANGYRESGANSKLLGSLAATLKSLGLPTKSVPSFAGSYSLDVTVSGAAATGIVLIVSTPSVKYGTSVVRVNATIAHQNVSVTPPSSPLVITPTLLKQLGGSSSSLLGGLG